VLYLLDYLLYELQLLNCSEPPNSLGGAMSSRVGWEKLIAQACVKTALMDPAASSWIAPLVERGESQGLGYDTIARNVRSTGDELSADEKRGLRMRANAKAGRKYVEALTPRGRDRPLDAAFLVVQYAMHQQALGDLSTMFQPGIVDEVEVIFAEDARTCDAVKRLGGKKFRQGEIPRLPLAGCDAEYCRCLYVAIIAD
jgi:hypothetical protein